MRNVERLESLVSALLVADGTDGHLVVHGIVDFSNRLPTIEASYHGRLCGA